MNVYVTLHTSGKQQYKTLRAASTDNTGMHKDSCALGKPFQTRPLGEGMQFTEKEENPSEGFGLGQWGTCRGQFFQNAAPKINIGGD